MRCRSPVDYLPVTPQEGGQMCRPVPKLRRKRLRCLALWLCTCQMQFAARPQSGRSPSAVRIGSCGRCGSVAFAPKPSKHPTIHLSTKPSIPVHSCPTLEFPSEARAWHLRGALNRALDVVCFASLTAVPNTVMKSCTVQTWSIHGSRTVLTGVVCRNRSKAAGMHQRR